MNANEKLRKYSKIRLITKLISIMLILSLLMGNMLMVTAKNDDKDVKVKDKISASDDPMKYMKDKTVDIQQLPPELADNPADPANPDVPDNPALMDPQQPPQDDGSTDRYIVKYKPGKKDDFQEKLSKKVKSSKKAKKDATVDDGSNIEMLTLDQATLPSQFAADIQGSQAVDDIEYIQPDFKLSLDSLEDIPVDNSTQSDATDTVPPVDNGTQSISTDSTSADSSLTPAPVDTPPVEFSGVGTSDIVVAVIDTGADINHPDLAGYIDTADMWDFTQNTNEVYSSANPLEYARGTHIVGTIANTARDNGIDDVKIMPLRVFNNGAAYTSDIIAAISYAVEHGATIINCSFGSTEDNPALEETIANANALFICAVGNSRRNLAEAPSYPSCYDLPNIISVASVNADGGFSYFSNYSADMIDITAIGREVTSALPENEHGTMTGTSMSAGYVTAVAAVVDAENSLTTGELKSRLLDTADMLSNLQDKVNQGRRINLADAVKDIVQTDIIQNSPADDFDVNGYQPDQSELFELFSNKNIVKTAGGNAITLCLMTDGSVWTWGDNNLGQLGNGNTAIMEELTQVTGLSSVKDIAAGTYHSLAIKTDGTVWAWGYNAYGQLGDGTTTSRSAPVQVTGLTNIIAVAAGIFHSLALQSDGTVWAWGYNAYGQFGNGTTTDSSVPVKIASLTNITAITAGEYFSVAVKNNDTVWAWGSNVYGFLGDGTTTTKYSPVQALNLTGITAISSRNAHTLARKSDGTVWAWGYNGYGQLGDGTTTSRYIPFQIAGLSSIKEIAVGSYHSLVVKTDGSLYTWGLNNYGQIGNGTTANVLSPYLVQGVSNVKNVSAGYYHSIALTNTNDIWEWGSNKCGELGNGTAGIYKKSPVIVNVSITSAKIVGGYEHSMVLDTSGNIWVTGQNANGELGTGNTTQVSVFTKNANISGVKDISLGRFHGLAVKTDGTVWAWGLNNYGQLGIGNTTNNLTPVQITNLTGVTAVAAGYYHSMALKSDGTVWAWGYNAYGELGTGNTTNSSVPVQVPGLTNVIAITSGEYYSVALKSDGTVWAWGSNTYGFLGDGTTATKYSPVQVLNLTGVTAISSKNAHTLAIKNDGTVWAWGYNVYGQLGDGTTATRPTPVQIPGLSGIKDISVGGYHSIAVKSDGSLYTWGYNANGQLGDGTKINRNTPQLIKNVNATKSGAGYTQSFAYTSASQVLAWGENKINQLGLDVNIYVSVPAISQLNKDAVGDTSADAVVKTLSGASVTVGDYVNNTTDKDWYAFTSTTASQYMIVLSTIDPNIKMTVYDANMAVLYTGNSTTVNFTANQKYYVCTEYNQSAAFTESWCDVIVSPVTSANIAASITKAITNGSDLTVVCSLSNITTFYGITFKITYNPTQVDLVDFAAQTPAADLALSLVPDTDLEIVSYNASTGVLTFKVNKTITAGNMWSGAVTILRFRAKTNGSTTVNFDKV